MLGTALEHEDVALISAFSHDQQRRNLRPRTIDGRRSALRLFAAHCEDLLGATPTAVTSWLDSRPLAPISRGHYLSYLHNFYVWAIREGLTASDPTVRVPTPRRRKYLPRPISEEDLSVAFGLAEPRMAAMLGMASYGGLRCMEIAGLRVEDIFWTRDPPLVLIHGKGDKDRVVPLAQRAEWALRAYGLPRFGPVFPKRDGTHYRPGTVSSMINDFLHGCGITHTAHTLRHRFGTEVYRRSKDILLTKELMGHESVNTTMSYVAFSGVGAEVVRDL